MIPFSLYHIGLRCAKGNRELRHIAYAGLSFLRLKILEYSPVVSVHNGEKLSNFLLCVGCAVVLKHLIIWGLNIVTHVSSKVFSEMWLITWKAP